MYPSKRQPLPLNYKITTKTTGYEKTAGFAKYNGTTARFEHTLTIRSDVPFKVRQTDAAQCARLGFPALYIVASKGNVFRFSDLPFELRCQILRYVLEQKEPFMIKERKIARGCNLNRAVQVSFGRKKDPAHRGLIKNDGTDKWIGMGPSPFAVLQVDKAMLAEAAPIAYGHNVFSFTSIGGCTMFLGGIGGMSKYLKHVSFEAMILPLPQALGKVLSRMQILTCLKSAEFSIGAICCDHDRLIYFYTMLLQRAHVESLETGHVFNIAQAVRMTFNGMPLPSSDDELVAFQHVVANALERDPVASRMR